MKKQHHLKKYLAREDWESDNTEDTEPDRCYNEKKEVPEWTGSMKSLEVEKFLFIIVSYKLFNIDFRFQMMWENVT